MTVTKKWPLLFADYSESFLVLGYAKEIKVYSLIESAFQRLPHGFTFPSSLMSMAVYGTYLITVTDSRLGLYELKFGTLLSTMSLPITEEIMAVHCHIQAPYLFSTLIQPSSDHVDQWYVQWFRTQLHWPSSIQWIHVLGKQPRTSHPCPMSTFTLPSVMALHSQAHFEKEENFLNNLNSKLVENNNEAVVKTWESLVFSFIQDHPRISMGLQTSLLEWASNPVHFSMSWISFAFHQGWWIPTCLPSTFLLDLVHHQVDIQFFEALIPLAEDRLLETFLSQALVSPSSYLLSVLRQPCSLPLHFLSFDLSCTLGDFLVQHLDECSLDWVLALIDAKWTCLPTDFFSNLQSWTQQRGPPMDTLVLAHLNMLFRQQQADLKLQKKSLKHLPGYQKVNLRL
ncbi:hypothetical protein HMI55_006607 [Coelomomyces lativittatus]|nr:hypothetical protein HMI55_006607 [Coelomomyces lativittatus]